MKKNIYNYCGYRAKLVYINTNYFFIIILRYLPFISRITICTSTCLVWLSAINETRLKMILTI